MRLYSYVVARDHGFAPNPFHGVCTLATCKPQVRRTAQLGDWIVGTGAKPNGLEGRLVYAMRVSEALGFEQYWTDARFRAKRPNLYASRMQAYGDNIYHRDALGQWAQENSHHSREDGTIHQDNLAHDTQTDRVLISDQFTYWGGQGPEVPARFRDWQGEDICAHRFHKCRLPEQLVSEFLEWLSELWGPGCVGRPAEW